MNKKLYVVFWLTIILMVGFQISYLFNTYWPVKLLDIKTPLPVLTPRVKAGEDLIYHADYCRYFKGNVKVFRSFIGPSVINLPSIDSITDPGCRVVDIHLTIPIYAVSGQYKMKAIAEFQVTATRLERVYYETDEFQVY